MVRALQGYVSPFDTHGSGEDEAASKLNISAQTAELEQELTLAKAKQAEQEIQIADLQCELASSKSRQRKLDVRMVDLEYDVTKSQKSQAQQAKSIRELRAQVDELKKLQGRCASIFKALGIFTQGSGIGASLVADPPMLRKVSPLEPATFKEWYWKMQAKLEEMRDCDEQTKIDYVVSRTTETAFSKIRDHLPYSKSAVPLKKPSNKKDLEVIQTADEILAFFAAQADVL